MDPVDGSEPAPSPPIGAHPREGVADDGLLLPARAVEVEGGDDEKVMSLVEHLTELRSRILFALGMILVAACFTLYNAQALTRTVVATAPGVEFIALTPMEVFFTELKIGFLCAVIVAVPVISWQIWAFIRPGLKHGEIRVVRFLAPAASLLFILGAAFAFYVVVPVGVRFLSSFGMEGVRPQYSLAAYTSFVLFFVLALGLLFEGPLVLLLLARIGLIRSSTLRDRRRHVVLACFVLSAVLTPTPDMVTQTLVAVPMWLLFELTLLVMRGMRL